MFRNMGVLPLFLSCRSLLNLVRQALQTALLDPIFGLYTTNFSEPLLQSQGLRQYYEFGLYAHCGYNESSVGLCSNHSAAYQYRPYAIMTGDMRWVSSPLRTSLGLLVSERITLPSRKRLLKELRSAIPPISVNQPTALITLFYLARSFRSWL